jgi:hypothetical protein
MSLCTETIPVQFTRYERTLLEGLADMRGVTASDLVRELMGLERADEATQPIPRLRLVST